MLNSIPFSGSFKYTSRSYDLPNAYVSEIQLQNLIRMVQKFELNRKRVKEC